MGFVRLILPFGGGARWMGCSQNETCRISTQWAFWIFSCISVLNVHSRIKFLFFFFLVFVRST